MSVVTRQPLLTDDAAYIIQHVNEDHAQELLYCVRAFTPHDEPTDAKLLHLYEDGIEVQVGQNGQLSREFIAYLTPAEGVRGLVSDALKKLNIQLEGAKRSAQWTITDNQAYAGCFRRITFHLGEDERSDWQAGTACRFVLPEETAEDGQPVSRPYTLRRVTGSAATIDVYVHDATAGSRWALGLDGGNTVQVIGNRAERFPDFGEGRAALLGDETALPTIAALLDGWAHEQPVRVLLEVGDPAAQRYLDDVHLPPQCHVSWLPRRADQQAGQSLLTAVETLETPIAAIWGATETSAAKQLRAYLKSEHGLSSEQGRVIGYWSAGKE